MIAWLVKTGLSWFTGGGFKALTEIYSKYKDSANESERIQAEWAKAKLDAMLQVRLATAGFWEMRLITFLIAVPFVFHLWTVWLDTQFNFGWKISAFPSPFNEWQGAILLSFFGIYAAGKVGMGLVSSLASRR
jgi:hypothetical protein